MIDVSSREARSRFYQSHEWKELRHRVLERDNFECQWCKAEGRVNTDNHSVMEVDHIYELKDYPELALEENFLRALCKDCHNKRHERFNYRPKAKEIKWNDERWD